MKPHLAILIEEGRKDNLFTFRLADRIRSRGGRVTFVFTRAVARNALISYINGHNVFLAPTWKNEISMRYGMRGMMLGGWVRELHQRNVDLLLAVLDFSQNSYLLSEMHRRYGTPGAVIARCIIPKQGTWEVEPGRVVRLSWLRQVNSAIQRFMLRREALDKRLTRSQNTYFAWGEYDRERLIESGVAPKHILVTGCPLYEGMLERSNIERVQDRRAETDAIAMTSTTAVVYSQPLEKPFMLGPEKGLRAKGEFLRGLVLAGFKRFVVHLHPEESEFSSEFTRAVGVPIDMHRDMDLALRLELLQQHGWYFTIASTSVFEGLYTGARSYLYQAPGLGPVDRKLPGFPVLSPATIAGVRREPYDIDRDALVARWIADADHSLTNLEDWIARQLNLPGRAVSKNPVAAHQSDPIA